MHECIYCLLLNLQTSLIKAILPKHSSTLEDLTIGGGSGMDYIITNVCMNHHIESQQPFLLFMEKLKCFAINFTYTHYNQ